MLFNSLFSEGGHSAFPIEGWESSWTLCLGWSDPAQIWTPRSSSLRASLTSPVAVAVSFPLFLFVSVTPAFGFRAI